MKVLLGFFVGAAYVVVVPVTAWNAGAEPAAMLVLGTCLLCAGFLRRSTHPRHSR